MATVLNKASEVEAQDKSFCAPNRYSAGDPNGTLVPEYVGEIVQDTTNSVLYRAVGQTNENWVVLSQSQQV